MIADAFPNFPRLQTERLTLRELRPEDAEDLFLTLTDPEVTRYYDDDPFAGPDQARDQIESWRDAYARRLSIRWGLEDKDGGRLLGTCGFYGFHSLHLRASIGYELNRGHWRRGLMTEALGAALGYGFETLGLRRVQAFVMPENQASVALLVKLGFANEGVLRDYETWGSKGFVDLACFAKLAG